MPQLLPVGDADSQLLKTQSPHSAAAEDIKIMMATRAPALPSKPQELLLCSETDWRTRLQRHAEQWRASKQQRVKRPGHTPTACFCCHNQLLSNADSTLSRPP